MRKIFIASIFIFIFCVFAFGQDKKVVSCPTVSITGPSSNIPYGENLVFKATVDFPDSDKLRYEWSIDENSVIIDGQGKNVITVRAVKRDVITVTVDVAGLPEGCEASDSESTVTDCGGLPSLMIDEIGSLSDAITKERLDDWIKSLENDPKAKLYIISYNNKKFPPKEYKDRESFIEKHLLDKNIRTDRIVFIKDDINDDDMNNRMKIFIVPEGATLPIP